MQNNTQAPDIKEIFADIEKQVMALAEATVSNFKDQAVADAKVLVNVFKHDIIRWTNLLSTGQITIAEFEFLVGSEKTITKMVALEQAGLAQLRISAFMSGVLNVVTDVVLKTVIGNETPASTVVV
ncbi:MAG: hypothetical protein ABIN94_13595 [Ferruginibacter sp.]